MKKITLALVLALFAISFNLQAQSTAVDKIFDKYNGKEGFTSVTMNKYMFEMISRMDTTAQGKEFSQSVSKLESIRILAIDSARNKGINLYDEVMRVLPSKEYKELMTVKDEGTDVKFMVREKGDIITELLLIAGGSDDENALIVIKGEIDLASIGTIARKMNIEGMEQLKNLDHKKKK
ncbi:MAG: DUF4252 domain-containing protein [Bacteroidales bacterium]|nr:DUF4252 domain-containing protein [Bacteroidales bacterium]